MKHDRDCFLVLIFLKISVILKARHEPHQGCCEESNGFSSFVLFPHSSVPVYTYFPVLGMSSVQAMRSKCELVNLI